MAATTPAVTRIVPGAPPVIVPSKSQKRKRKSNKTKTPDSPVEGSPSLVDVNPTTPLDKAPEESEAKECTGPVELVAASETPTNDDALLKPSPVVELLQKRMRALNKKISRIAGYASTDYEKLNDDQKRNVKTLSSLEAVQKELEEVKRAIEVHEAEVARELALKRADVERLEAQKFAQAVSSTQALCISRMSSILTLLRIRSLLSAGNPLPAALGFDEVEGSVIFTTCEILVGEECDSKQALISGLLTGQGEIDGVAYTRLFEVVQSFLNPRREPTPLPDPTPDTPEAEAEAEAAVDSAPDEPVSGIPDALNVSNSFRFMQASELDNSETNTEWVDKHDPPEAEIEVNGVPEQEPNGTPDSTSTLPIDWAEADEDGLPSIANLQASLVPSEPAIPEVNLPTLAPVNGIEVPISGPQREDDGFTPTSRGGRGRGRGYRGDRGNTRGSGFRGDRGGFHRGFRGGHRGGDRARRGRSDTEGRGGDEPRGRGRGRGRREERGGM
ncbi:hypothetical protein SCLCIDRAFT_121600 [Scleroderma citrinum Foug A]|uniref:Uncharacterized protein n=1 Tax=Scleroderma citrinum Foug A TaxID=1036808 RepID=A0A0C2ZJ41_9AGAM|nr:hypothetical protein SCLCIDRAFT_121600 [Scleroderma citrinum Foug A]